MKVYGYAINNKIYEGTVTITRDDFEDDNLGAYSPLFQEMGRASAAQPDELVFTALRDGNKTDCYNGKPFLIASIRYIRRSTAAVTRRR